jgi:hypothetical protein
MTQDRQPLEIRSAEPRKDWDTSKSLPNVSADTYQVRTSHRGYEMRFRPKPMARFLSGRLCLSIAVHQGSRLASNTNALTVVPFADKDDAWLLNCS